MAFCELHYFSDALGKQTAAYVLLPETGTPPYPVMYLLHGLSDDHTIWLRRTSIERYVADLPLMVVMPDGGRGFYCDAVAGYAYDTAIAVELMDRIDRTFATRAAREGRCIAGLSMGGYGAAKLALAHPDRFAAAVSHSGALNFGHDQARWSEDGMAEWKRVLGADTLSGGPNDLYRLAKEIDRSLRPALRIDCGTDDFLIEENRAFHAYLESIGVPHEYAEFPGAHTWDYWDLHIQQTLAFFQRELGIKKPALPASSEEQ
jgi:S-formylglutathione hydrolase FrmB